MATIDKTRSTDPAGEIDQAVAVGQVDNLRRVGNPPRSAVTKCAQDAILPHIGRVRK